MTKSRNIRNTRKIWTKSEDKFLKKHYHYGAKLCACCLNVSTTSVHARAYKLGIPGVKGKRFTDEEIQYVKDNYAVLSNKEMGVHIGRSHWSIKNFASKLGLRRAQEESESIQKRCRCKTTFVKGHLPKNTKQDLAITIRTSHCGSNYKWIRISKANWVMLHVYQWEKKYGPVPPGKILRNITGDSLDCSPDNWIPVNRAEHLEKNSGRLTLEDKYIANILATKNKQFNSVYRQMPELLELKRNELKLRRTINELTETAKTN